MLYLVEAHASMERGNKIDAEKGPGPIFAKVVERFRPEAFYGNPRETRQQNAARERRLRNRKPSGDAFPTEGFCNARPTRQLPRFHAGTYQALRARAEREFSTLAVSSCQLTGRGL